MVVGLPMIIMYCDKIFSDRMLKWQLKTELSLSEEKFQGD